VKIKKRAGNFSLELIPTRDILDSLGRRRDRQFLLVGFAAETNDVEQNAAKKLRAKNCDIMVANDARLGMESAENELIILFRDGEIKTISRAPKRILARELVKIFKILQQKCLTKKM
jgi:phosphopantothenoylcysteine decarboxylase/phosphopantothenate--cysteine ligase